MIPLEDWEYKLLDKISSENSTDYNIKMIDNEYYIKKYDLMSLIEDTQDNREYAEEKVKELSNAMEED